MTSVSAMRLLAWMSGEQTLTTGHDKFGGFLATQGSYLHVDASVLPVHAVTTVLFLKARNARSIIENSHKAFTSL
jgi:hypothetical protein